MLREISTFGNSTLEQKVSPAGSFLPQANSILELGADYFGIINQQGKLEAVTFKNDINLSKEKKDMLCMGLRLQSSMQCDFDEELGPVSYTMIERNNTKFVSIPFSSYTILTVMNKEIDHISIIKKAKAILRKFNDKKKFPKSRAY